LILSNALKFQAIQRKRALMIVGFLWALTAGQFIWHLISRHYIEQRNRELTEYNQQFQEAWDNEAKKSHEKQR
jgi:hypothetical protein